MTLYITIKYTILIYIPISQYTYIHIYIIFILFLIKMKKLLKDKNFSNLKRNHMLNINKSVQPIKFIKKGFFNGGENNFFPKSIKYVLIGNAFIYVMGISMNQSNYVREFFFNKTSFLNGKYHSIITNHFAKRNIFEFAIDSIIFASIGGSISVLAGEVILQKLVIASIASSSLILLLSTPSEMHYHSDAILRGVIYYLVLKDPKTSFMLFPLPIKIQAMYIGLLIGVLDILSGKYCNFGGLLSAGLILRGRF